MNLHMATCFHSSWVIFLDESMSICIISGHVQDGFSVHASFIHLSMNITLLAVVRLVSCFLLNFLREKIILEGAVQWNSHNLARQLDYFCICSISYFQTGTYVVLDSGFCVLEAFIELKHHGLFGCALIKKCKFWPTHIPGEEIENHMKNKGIGETDAIQETFNGITYNLWAMKEPEDVMKMMATGGSLLADGSCCTTICYWLENGVDQVKEFAYSFHSTFISVPTRSR